MPIAPLKADAPLVIDADTVLVLPASFKTLQAVSRQAGEGAEVRRGV